MVTLILIIFLFRRLCILKGIYPREPKNKKKVNKGSTAFKTYYYTKDIQFLAHEPVLQKFRETKIFLRKLKRAYGKEEYSDAERLEKSKLVYSLDHIVKERLVVKFWPFKRQPPKMVKHWNDSSAVADKLFECVWPFCGFGA